MTVVSLLLGTQWNYVVRGSPIGTQQVHVPDGAGLITVLHERECGCAVVDPALVTDVSFDTLVREAAVMAVPLVLVGGLTTQAVEACLVAEMVGPVNVLFSDIINQDWLRFVLADSVGTDVPARVLHHAQIAIRSLPIHIQRSTVALFTGGNIAASVKAFGAAAGVSRKTVQRWNARAGLAHPARLLTIARLARTWRLLRSRRISLLRAAALVGFESERTLSRSCLRIARCTAASIRDYSSEEFASRLALALLPRTGTRLAKRKTAASRRRARFAR